MKIIRHSLTHSCHHFQWFHCFFVWCVCVCVHIKYFFFSPCVPSDIISDRHSRICVGANDSHVLWLNIWRHFNHTVILMACAHVFIAMVQGSNVNMVLKIPTGVDFPPPLPFFSTHIKRFENLIEIHWKLLLIGIHIFSFLSLSSLIRLCRRNIKWNWKQPIKNELR